MKALQNGKKYIVVGSTTITTPAGSELITTSIRDVKKTMCDHQNESIVVVINGDLYRERLVLLAFEFGAAIRINDQIEYDLNGIFESKKSREQNLFTLYATIENQDLAITIVKLLFNSLKNKIPSMYCKDDVLAYIRQSTNVNVDEAAMAELFNSLYEEHRIRIISTIKPTAKPNLVLKSMSYQNELSAYLQTQDGISVLAARMAAGKTLCGILPLFRSCLELNKKVMLITPTIALSKSLIQSFDNSLHYQQYEKNSDINHLPGLICCVNSAISKEHFYQFAQSCDVIIIDEFEECVGQLTEHLFQDNKLSNRAMLTQKLYSLLNKDKVVLADALFSDMSARHIVNATGRDITLINCSDSFSPVRTLKLLNRDEHVDLAIRQAQETRCEVGFSDGGQKLSNTYFELGQAVENGLCGKVNLVNADYIQSKEGDAFFQNPLEKMREAMFSLFSPAITSGQHFPFEQFKRVNLFASETISPLKLVQSSGRFRNAYNVQVSFSKRTNEYHSDINAIRVQEVVATTSAEEFADEMEAVIGEPWAERVIERIAQDRMLRQNYANNSLILFQHLGASISNQKNGSSATAIKLSTTLTKAFSCNIVSNEAYKQMLSCFDLLNHEQRLHVGAYQTLDFYHVLNQKELHQQVLEFDQNGKGQTWVKNMHFLRNSEAVNDLSSEEKLRQLVTQKVLNLLGLESEMLTGVYNYRQINQLQQFFQSGRVQLMGRDVLMRHISQNLFDIPYKSYKNVGAFSKQVLNRLFGLKQIQAGRDKSKAEGEYSYKVCPESIKRIHYFGALANGEIDPYRPTLMAA